MTRRLPAQVFTKVARGLTADRFDYSDKRWEMADRSLPMPAGAPRWLAARPPLSAPRAPSPILLTTRPFPALSATTWSKLWCVFPLACPLLRAGHARAGSARGRAGASHRW